MSDSKEKFSVLHQRTLSREFLCGGIAGSTGILVGYPFDLIKVKLQANPTLYKSAFECFTATVKETGYIGLYHGSLIPVVLQGAISSLLFVGEATAMRLLEPTLKAGEMGTILNTLLAGSCGGFLQCIVLVPVEVIKCTMQVDQTSTSKLNRSDRKNVFVDTWSYIRTIYINERGIRGFYKGFGATVSRECPAIGSYFLSYKLMKEFWKNIEGKETPSASSILLSGGLAGAISWASVYPFDVVKTNMQIMPRRKITMLSMAKQLHREHGFRVFTRGIGITLLRAFPVNASTFYVYEKLQQYFRNH